MGNSDGAGGAGSPSPSQIQLFVSVRKGSEWPPRTVDVRVSYESTLGDLRAAAADKLGIPVADLQLWRHKEELRPGDNDSKTMLELDVHTGFGWGGWDLSVPPAYWPPAKPASDAPNAPLVLDC